MGLLFSGFVDFEFVIIKLGDTGSVCANKSSGAYVSNDLFL